MLNPSVLATSEELMEYLKASYFYSKLTSDLIDATKVTQVSPTNNNNNNTQRSCFNYCPPISCPIPIPCPMPCPPPPPSIACQVYNPCSTPYVNQRYPPIACSPPGLICPLYGVSPPPSIACQVYNPYPSPCSPPCPPPCPSPCPPYPCPPYPCPPYPYPPCNYPCYKLAPNPTNPTDLEYETILSDIENLFNISKTFLNSKYGDDYVKNLFYSNISGSNPEPQIAITLYTSSCAFKILVNSSSPNPDLLGSLISNTLTNSAWENNTMTEDNKDIPIPTPSVQTYLINNPNPRCSISAGFNFNTHFQIFQYSVGTNIVNTANNTIVGRLVVTLYNFPTCNSPCANPCYNPCTLAPVSMKNIYSQKYT